MRPRIVPAVQQQLLLAVGNGVFLWSVQSLDFVRNLSYNLHFTPPSWSLAVLSDAFILD